MRKAPIICARVHLQHRLVVRDDRRGGWLMEIYPPQGGNQGGRVPVQRLRTDHPGGYAALLRQGCAMVEARLFGGAPGAT